MGDQTAIAWTDKTWNPRRGCERISSGCANCYMFTAQNRYGRDPSKVVRTKTWGQPRKWQREAEKLSCRYKIFTCSWSDWFIEDADEWREEAWDVVSDCDRLDFQILTKRPERIWHNLPWAWWGPHDEWEDDLAPWKNVWLGVSVENRKQGLPRIDHLREIPATVRFLSVEPLLEDLGEINLDGIDWVIVGGESGPGYRPMDPAWAISIRDQCRTAGVPFFFKQSSGLKPETGVELDGRIEREFPR